MDRSIGIPVFPVPRPRRLHVRRFTDSPGGRNELWLDALAVYGIGDTLEEAVIDLIDEIRNLEEHWLAEDELREAPNWTRRSGLIARLATYDDQALEDLFEIHRDDGEGAGLHLDDGGEIEDGLDDEHAETVGGMQLLVTKVGRRRVFGKTVAGRRVRVLVPSEVLADIAAQLHADPDEPWDVIIPRHAILHVKGEIEVSPPTPTCDVPAGAGLCGADATGMCILDGARLRACALHEEIGLR
jgi:hypothetical protein